MAALSILLLRAFFSFFLLPPASQLIIVSLYALTCSLYIVAIVIRARGVQIFIVNYGCLKPPVTWRAPFSTFMEHFELLGLAGKFNSQSIEFQSKILERSGLSQLTALPAPSFLYLPPRITIANERLECETALFGAMDDLLASVHVKPHQIGVIVTNCSVFSPTPSMTSMIIHKYKLPVDVKSFNLAGMGCSAGLLALDLAKRVLLAHPNKYALVLSTENLTRSLYYGNQRSMLVTNCLFRVGGSAVLLSNKWGDRKKSKYSIIHTARSHMGAHDNAYTSVYQEEDCEGYIGVGLSKNLTQSAALALEHNMRMLGPRVLPTWEIMLYLLHRLMSWVLDNAQANPYIPKLKLAFDNTQVKPYIPKFKLAFDNICIHAGGKAVIRTIEKSLDLPLRLSEASHMTLYRFGNLSSASVWYELAYEEAKGRVKRGNKVWQIGLGSGFKCCSSVLRALKTMDQLSSNQCWEDCIADMPVELPAEERHAK